MFSTRCLWISRSLSLPLVSPSCQPIEFAQLYRIHINAPHFTHKQLFSVAQPLLRLANFVAVGLFPPYIFSIYSIHFRYVTRPALHNARRIILLCTNGRQKRFVFLRSNIFMNAFSSLILLINHLDMSLSPSFWRTRARAVRMMLKVSFHGDCDKPNQLLALFSTLSTAATSNKKYDFF